MSNFTQTVWVVFEFFIFVAYMMVLFHIVVDLFRNSKMSGFSKAIWILGLILIPLVTAVIYIIANGGKMAERQKQVMERAKADTDAYVRQVVAKSPAEQIADAKSLLDSGTIDAQEFSKLKAKALT